MTDHEPRSQEAIIVDSLLNYLSWIAFMAELKERRRERRRKPA